MKRATQREMHIGLLATILVACASPSRDGEDTQQPPSGDAATHGSLTIASSRRPPVDEGSALAWKLRDASVDEADAMTGEAGDANDGSIIRPGGASCATAVSLVPDRASMGDISAQPPSVAPCGGSASRLFYTFTLPAYRRAVVTVVPIATWRPRVIAFTSCDADHCIAERTASSAGAAVTLTIDSPGSDPLSKWIAVDGATADDRGPFQISMRLERVGGGSLPVDLGTLAGLWSVANAVSANGLIVGASAISMSESHAVIWDHGTITDIGTLGGAFASATDVNDVGEVVGYGTIPSGEVHAFSWHAGTMTDLGAVAGRSAAAAINRDGVIAGYRIVSDESGAQAVRWQSHVAEDLAGIGSQSNATAINVHGDIAGQWFLGAPARWNAFVWTEGTVMFLPSAGAADFVWGMNDARDVVGFYYRATDFIHEQAVLWTGGSAISLGTLSPGEGSHALAINNRGEIVGASGSGSDFRGFHWVGGVMTVVPGIEGASLTANDINDAGTIVGTSLNGAGERHAFVLQP